MSILDTDPAILAALRARAAAPPVAAAPVAPVAAVAPPSPIASRQAAMSGTDPVVVPSPLGDRNMSLGGGFGNPGVRGTAGPASNDAAIRAAAAKAAAKKKAAKGGASSPSPSAADKSPTGDPILDQLRGIFGPQEDAINSATHQDTQDLSSYGQAEAGLLKDIGGRVRGGFDTAADAVAGYGGGLSDAFKQRMEGFGEKAFSDLAPGAGDATRFLGSILPGASFREQGAGFGAAADFLPLASLTSTKYSIASRQKQGATALAALLAKEPAEYQKMVKAKFDEDLKVRSADLADRKQTANEVDDKTDNTRQAAKDAADITYKTVKLAQDGQFKAARLTLDSQKEADKLTAAAVKASTVDSAASKVLGYVVDRTGNPVLAKDGTKIKVAASAGAKNSGTPFAKAVKTAQDLRGEPVKNPNPGALNKGAYMARPGAKGVYNFHGVLTTNDPTKALFNTTMKFAEAIEYIVALQGVSRADARKALVASGWQPDGQRPKPVTQDSTFRVVSPRGT